MYNKENHGDKSMISTKGRYALRLMTDIAAYSGGKVVSLKDVSARQEISPKYAEQVVSLMVKSGLLISVRGNNGGYVLAKSPGNYTAGEILRAAEGTLSPVACIEDNSPRCSRIGQCPAVDFWRGYYKAVTDYVNGVTLEQLANAERDKVGNDYNI